VTGNGLTNQMTPGSQILLKAFLRLELVRYHYDGSVRETPSQHFGHERLGCATDTGTGAHASLLHAADQELCSGSLQHFREQVACREEF